jgi:hypothetical protein
MMVGWYPEEQWHRLVYGPDVDPGAVKAKARDLKRWPERI